jgi:polysaccharide chain length determinant protein (PEP-CTERM system associated)
MDSMAEESTHRSGFNQVYKVLRRRKGVISSTAIVLFTLSAHLTFNLPDTFRSNTLLLVSPQRLPASYITSTVTQSAQERIYGITQHILSRTNLEKIVTEFNLYAAAKWTNMEDRVQQLRKKIRINVQADQSGVRRETSESSSAFLLSFDAEAPDKATLVTGRLAALFIDENIRIREQQATGTTNFINTEAERIRKVLEQQESEVNRYKSEHRFELQEQLDANVKSIEQFRVQLQNNMVRLAALRERKADLEKQIMDAETGTPREKDGSRTERPETLPQVRSIEDKRIQLKSFLAQYSVKHPDVVRLKNEIETLEKEEVGKSDPALILLYPKTPVGQMIRRQLGEVQIEIHSLDSTTGTLRGDIIAYQRRIDNTPVREIEFSKISRDYQITLKKYQDLLAKTMESQLSENMEKQQKGEQFQILDPASMPQKPIFPNRPLILLGGLFGGLAAGLVFGCLMESSDTSIKKGDVVENLPLLVMLPQVSSRRSVLERRRAVGFFAFTSISCIVIGMVIIHLTAPIFFY